MVKEAFHNDVSLDDDIKPQIIYLTDKAEKVELNMSQVDNPIPNGTLGDIGIFTRVQGATKFPVVLLIQPFDIKALTGIDATSVRVFRWNEESQLLQPIWNCGINLTQRFVWTKIQRSGIYIPIGLPRDRYLQGLIRDMAHQRHYADGDSQDERNSITRSSLAPFIEISEDDLDKLRRSLAINEFYTGLGYFSSHDIQYGHGGHPLAFPLPKGVSFRDLKDRIVKLETPKNGLPEEALFYSPERSKIHEHIWPLHPRFNKYLPLPKLLNIRLMASHMNRPGRTSTLSAPTRLLESKDWWMYHGDPQHTGQAAGSSNISSTSIQKLTLFHSIHLDDPVISIPSVVQGKIYVGTSGRGKLYKIDLVTGRIDDTFPKEGEIDDIDRIGYYKGVGGSPAIYNGRIYFSSIPGKIWCIDANTMALVWSTDIRNADPLHNQPVQNIVDPDNPFGRADCWSSPLIANGKVYVACGEGEGGVFGFVYCLDADTGIVVWLFCTNKFSEILENTPNTIPKSAVIGNAPAGFTVKEDPKEKGVSVLSSCAYSQRLNRIYVGTGNSSKDPSTLPDEPYGCGILSLDADTGDFKGFYATEVEDNYRQDDEDVDIIASPMLYVKDGLEVLAIGSKNGSFFLLDPESMKPIAKRQLLPKYEDGSLIPAVDQHFMRNENMSGVFGTAAVHYGSGRLFVGVGGYQEMASIDYRTTPFMRALDWDSLSDAWQTRIDTIGGGKVKRYVTSRNPMYTSPAETGLTSPAVVNDLVFVSTTKPALYAFDIETGKCLWTAPNFSQGRSSFVLGPAIYGDYVIIGNGNVVRGTEEAPSHGQGSGSINIYSIAQN